MPTGLTKVNSASKVKNTPCILMMAIILSTAATRDLTKRSGKHSRKATHLS